MSKPNRTRVRTHGHRVPQRPRRAKPNVFVVTHAAHRTKLGGRAGFDYPVVQEGQTTNFVVFRDSSLGPDGTSCADGVLATCENDYAQTAAWFGIAAPQLPINIIIAALDPSGQGGGGAYHYGCSAIDLYCDLKNGPSLDIDFTRMLLVAELVEVFEAAQSLGWDCRCQQRGGALTRSRDRALSGRARRIHDCRGLARHARPTGLGQQQQPDRSRCRLERVLGAVPQLPQRPTGIRVGPDCTGWRAHALQTYTKLTGNQDGWKQFRQQLDNNFPLGTPSGLTTDNPYPLP